MSLLKSMKFRVVPVLLAAAFVYWIPCTAFAQGFPTITVDENCHGTINFGVFVTGLPCGPANDPGPGGLNGVLTYNLLGPPDLTAGDVLLQDGTGGPIQDLIRFNPAGTGGDPTYTASLVFYSDNNLDGVSSGADGPPPQALYTNNITVPEFNVGGVERVSYTPGPGNPGFVSAPFAVTYNIISDTPEPATLTLLGSGLMGLVGMIRKRKLSA